jgi:membrane protease subunit HflC
MKSGLLFTLAVVALLAVIGLAGAVFTVSQTEQALVLRLGEPVAGRGLITQPGLHFKFPLIENVVTFDNRILDVESPNLEVLAADNQRLEVDSFIRYRIVDALRFYQTVNSVLGANNQLGSVLNSAVRRVLSEANQQQIVRDERAALMVKIKEQADRESSTRASAASIFRSRFRKKSSGACRPSASAKPRNIAPRVRSTRKKSPPRRIATSSC